MDRCPNVLAGRKVVPERANQASLLRCTVASAFEVGIDTVRERLALQRYLDSLEKADEEAQANIDQSAVQAALEKIRKDQAKPRAGSGLHASTPAGSPCLQHPDCCRY
jgi:hypothetical protein